MYDFENGGTSLNDEWSGWTSTSRFEPLIAWVKYVHGNLHPTAQEVAEEDGISIGSCHTTFTEDFGMAWFSEKFVPRLSDL
jgi:hypothetical protein